MEHIYSTGYDHDVKAVVLYTDDEYLYLDEDRTIGATHEMVEDLFVRNLLLVRFGSGYARPYSMSDGGEYYGATIVVDFFEGGTMELTSIESKGQV